MNGDFRLPSPFALSDGCVSHRFFNVNGCGIQESHMGIRLLDQRYGCLLQADFPQPPVMGAKITS
jgi:hypothetical protein